VAASGLILAGLTGAMVWGATGLSHHLTTPLAASSGAGKGGGGGNSNTSGAADDPKWYPPQEEIDRNWPRFRGPAGTGIASLPNLPETWDGASGKNVLWKTEIPLPGNNSPVLWGGRIFLTGATEKKREVYCIDAANGTLLWSKPVTTPQASRLEAPEVLEDTGYAPCTAVTDGRRVIAMFANGEIGGFAVDGKPLWSRHLGTPENMYGHATSLAMWLNRVIVVFDQGDGKEDKSKILALDAATGQTVWSTPRKVANSWATPLVITVAGKPQIITAANPWLSAYDPATGKELWQAKCLKGDVAPSPTFGNDLVFAANDGACLVAVHPDGSGDVTSSKVAWKWKEGSLPDICSPLCDGPRVYMLSFGVLQAFDSLTGNQLWENDLKAEFQASPSLVNGKLWLLTRKGVMIMGEATNEGFKETGRCELGDTCGASPSFAPGRVYLRGKKHLYCIGAKDGK
jgi:outer membrane protein assembly factor BamB